MKALQELGAKNLSIEKKVDKPCAKCKS